MKTRREREEQPKAFGLPSRRTEGSSRRPPLLPFSSFSVCRDAECYTSAYQLLLGRRTSFFSEANIDGSLAATTTICCLVLLSRRCWGKQLAPSAITDKLFFGSCWNKNKVYLGCPSLHFQKIVSVEDFFLSSPLWPIVEKSVHFLVERIRFRFFSSPFSHTAIVLSWNSSVFLFLSFNYALLFFFGIYFKIIKPEVSSLN